MLSFCTLLEAVEGFSIHVSVEERKKGCPEVALVGVKGCSGDKSTIADEYIKEFRGNVKVLLRRVVPIEPYCRLRPSSMLRDRGLVFFLLQK